MATNIGDFFYKCLITVYNITDVGLSEINLLVNNSQSICKKQRTSACIS